MLKSENYIKRVVKHKNVAITTRGNEAIKRDYEIVKKNSFRNKVLVPDQGGWLTYHDYAIRFGFDVVELKTDKGLVILDELKKHVNDCACFIFSAFAGYYAEQPLREIFHLCRKSKCICINDVSGAFGDKVLCDGSYSEIVVCSFGKWKIVNFGKYGFISSSLFDVGFSVQVKGDLYSCLVKAKGRLEFLLSLAEKVKKDLIKFDVYHASKRGVNVVVGYSDEVVRYCRSNDYEYVICPKYIKVLEHAVSIELKRE